MEREVLNKVDYLHIVAVKAGDVIRRYEISSKESEGFYRVSEESVAEGKVYFPGSWDLDVILSDIKRVETN